MTTRNKIIEVAEWLRLFVEPGQVTEMRALKVTRDGSWPKTLAGFFDHDHLEEMAQIAMETSANATGVYFIPNPVRPEMLARCANRIRPVGEGESVSDDHILARHWLLIDADPVRLQGVSATDAEKEASHVAIFEAREIVANVFGLSDPIMADSGNGYHLLYRVDWSANDIGQAKSILEFLADLLDSEHVSIDTATFNAARITKLYGTISRKGDSTKDRPHRRSCII